LNESSLLFENILEDSKLIEVHISGLRHREDSYEFLTIIDSILEIVANDFEDLKNQINKPSHLDD